MEALKKLKTFQSACKIENVNPKTIIPDFSQWSKKDQKAMIAHAKLVIIVRAANRLANDGKEWTPDWKDSSEWKYESWFYLGRGSSGFRFYDCAYWGSSSSVGSRLCFKSREVGEYVAKQFLNLYEDYML